MIGALIGAGTSLISGIIGSASSRRANKQAQKEVDNLKSEQKAWYEKNINSDYSQRADIQAAWERQRQLLLESNRNAEASQAVTGATDESVALQKKNAADSLAQTGSNIAAQGAAYKDNIEAQHQNNLNNQANTQANIYNQRAHNNAQAASEGVKAGAGIISSVLSGVGDNSKKEELYAE